MSTLSDHLRKVIPRCLAHVRATATALIDVRDCTATAFLLSQIGSGAATAQILGFPLADYNPACEGDPDFIGPLTLRWLDATEACVFDSDIHGYHGEMASSPKLRGTGIPKMFACGNCGKDKFSVKVQFDYWDACDDLLEDEPEIPAENYFCNIIVVGVCADCGTINEVLDMDL